MGQALLKSPPPEGNVSFLFDEPKGTGVLSDGYPTPPSGIKAGYAGGLGPSNISAQLSKMKSSAPGRAVWCDMESSLRTIDAAGVDVFDMDKVMACVQQVHELDLAPLANYYF